MGLQTALWLERVFSTQRLTQNGVSNQYEYIYGDFHPKKSHFSFQWADVRADWSVHIVKADWNGWFVSVAGEWSAGGPVTLWPFTLQVRGAPAIAIVGCLSLAVELRAGAGGDDLVSFIRDSLCHLTSARPTAVNMGRAARELMEFTENESMEKNTEPLRDRWQPAGRSRVYPGSEDLGMFEKCVSLKSFVFIASKPDIPEKIGLLCFAFFAMSVK